MVSWGGEGPGSVKLVGEGKVSGEYVPVTNLSERFVFNSEDNVFSHHAS